MRLPVGSVVFVSHRRKRVVFRVCKVLGKNTSQGREDFSPNRNGSTLQNREEHVTTFAY